MNGITSSSAMLTHGIPQGSILGPMLFNLHINDLRKVVNSDKILLYADDSVSFASSTSFSQACQIVNADLLLVHTYVNTINFL